MPNYLSLCLAAAKFAKARMWVSSALIASVTTWCAHDEVISTRFQQPVVWIAPD
jgi:hypothetical protein